MKFPIAYYHNNIVINTSGQIYAIYKFSGKPYNFLPENEKERVIREFENLLWGLKGKGQILILNEELNLGYEDYERICNVNESQEYEYHAESALKFLTAGARIKKRYLCLELSLSEEGTILSFMEEMRDSILSAFVGVERFSLSPNKIKKLEELEEELYKKIYNIIDARADINDIDFIIRRNVNRVGFLPPPINAKKAGIFTPGMISDFSNGSLIREHMTSLEIVDSSEKKQYQVFLTIPDLPFEVPIVGSEMIASLEQLEFPVDVAINFEVMPSHQARQKAQNKKEWLKQHIKEKYAGDEEASIEEEVGYASSKELINKASRGQPLLSISITLAVAAEEIKTVRVYAHRLIELYSSMGFRIVRPIGDQLKSFYSMLPATTVSTTKIQCDPGYLAALGPNISFSLGDQKGFFIGFTGFQPVFWKPGEAAKNNKSNAIFISGTLGSGKSFTAKLLVYLSALNNSHIFIIDPKNEYSSFKNIFSVKQINLSPYSDIQINPFMISDNLGRAKQYATDCISLLLNATSERDMRRIAIAQAVEITGNCEENKRNMNTFLEELYKMSMSQQFGDIAKEAAQCARMLEAIRQTGLGKILFGREKLKFKEKFTIINLKGLPLPKVSNMQITESERQGMALLFLASAMVREMVFSLPQDELKCCVFDEAWMLLNISEGRRIIEELVRMSARTQNAIPILVTQNATDINELQTLKNNITYYFAFRSNDKTEAETNTVTLGAEKGSLNQVFSGLRTGECIMRDMYSRIGRMRICACPEYLANIFNTTPG